MSIVLVAALFALQPQERIVTFSHPCDRASVVLVALGEELGMTLKPSGSVNDDYFLVRFDDVPVQEALDNIATTLNAGWQEREGVHYLYRSSRQEKEEVRRSVNLIRDQIRKLARTTQRAPMDLEDARDFVTRANGVVADSNRPREKMEDMGFLNAEIHFLYQIAEDLPLEPFIEEDLRGYYLFETPQWLGPRWPQSFDQKKSTMVKEIIAMQQAIDELASPQLMLVPPHPQRGSTPSVADSFAVQVRMSSLAPTLRLWRREDDSNRGRATVFVADQFEMAPVPDKVAALRTKWTPTADERRLMEVINKAGTTDAFSKEDKEFVEGIFDPEYGEPLTRFASSQFFLLADELEANIVAVLPDDMIVVSTSRVDPDQLSATSIVGHLFQAGLALTYDPTTELLMVKPVHPTIVRRDRFDRKSAHRFFRSSERTLTEDVALRAELAATSSFSAYYYLTGLYDLIFGLTIPPRASSPYDFLRILGSLPLAQRTAALNNGVDVPLSALSEEQTASVRSILLTSYSDVYHRDVLGDQWVRSLNVESKVPLQLWWDGPSKDARLQVFTKRAPGYVVKHKNGSLSSPVDPEYVGNLVASWESVNSEKYKVDTSQLAVVDREAVFIQLSFADGYLIRTIVSKPTMNQDLKFIPWADAPRDFHERYRVGLQQVRDLLNQGG